MNDEIAPRMYPKELWGRIAGALEQYEATNLKRPRTVEVGCWDLQQVLDRPLRPETTIYGIPLVEVHGRGIKVI